MDKRWIPKPEPAADVVTTLSAQLNINPTLAALLAQRGIGTFDEARGFFRPTLHQLHDPFLMKDMNRAVDRLERAISDGETILVYGDYDVDGTTSVAMMYGFLRTLHDQLFFYIPDRYTEGYGVSRQGVDWAHDKGVTLMITLDCGIKSAELVAYAHQLGIDCIVCDHHRPDDAHLPKACAVLDAKRSDCPYPYKELSGCGVGFKLLQGFCLQNDIPLDELYPFLDLVAVSVAADMVPITGENRVLTYFGLLQLNKHPRPGLRALSQLAGLEKELTVSNIVFGIGPRINAAGRIAHAHAAVELLLSETEAGAAEFARRVNLNNRDRQGYDTLITKEALQMIETNVLPDAKTTVLFKNDWHKGVIGIVASRCIEKYHRPTIILTESHEKAAGSARSVPGFDVYEAIAECADLLEQFGGHMYAAGLTLKVENVPAFRQKFEAVVARRITHDQLIPPVEIDASLHLYQITPKFYNIIRQMAPFGPENMQPVFVSEPVYAERVRVLKEQHLKMTVYQEDAPHFLEAIGFGMRTFADRVGNGQPFRLCYQITENDYRGTKSLQLMIKDIKFFD